MPNYCAHGSCPWTGPCQYGPANVETLKILSPEYPPRIPTRTESRMIGDTVAEQRRHFRYMRTSPLVTYEWHRDINGDRRPFPVRMIRYQDSVTRRNTYAL